MEGDFAFGVLSLQYENKEFHQKAGDLSLLIKF